MESPAREVSEAWLLVTGGTGGIGRRLVPGLLQQGYRVRLLVRSPEAAARLFPQGVELIGWRAGQPLPEAVLDGVWGILNFAGAPIARRWTQAYREEILQSRLRTTQALVQALRAVPHRVQVLLSVSAIGYYGDRGEEVCTEQTPPGSDFLATVCRLWEEAAQEAAEQVRVVIPRLGVVLDATAGFLPRLVPAFRLFLGGPLCSGRQWVSWIHWSDVLEFVLWALRNTGVRGVYNVVAPEPVRFRQLCVLLGQALRRPCWVPVPRQLLRLLYGELAEALCASQRVIPERLRTEGFVFRYAALRDALWQELSGGAAETKAGAPSSQMQQ